METSIFSFFVHQSILYMTNETMLGLDNPYQPGRSSGLLDYSIIFTLLLPF